jgi:hypothetical protein
MPSEAIDKTKTRCSAECTWGDGPDILVTISPRLAYPLMQVADGQYSYGLTVFEAKLLMNDLNAAIEKAEAYEATFHAAHPKAP